MDGGPGATCQGHVSKSQGPTRHPLASRTGSSWMGHPWRGGAGVVTGGWGLPRPFHTLQEPAVAGDVRSWAGAPARPGGEHGKVAVVSFRKAQNAGNRAGVLQFGDDSRKTLPGPAFLQRCHPGGWAEAEFQVSPVAKLPCRWAIVPREASVPVEPQHLVKSRVREGLGAASVPAPRQCPPLCSPGLGPGPPWSPPALRGSLLPDNTAGRA